jgi:hypothetical protein
VRRRLEGARSKYGCGKLFAYQVGQEDSGRLTLSWHVDQEGLARLEALEGVFLLKTDLAKKTHPMAVALRTYRGQIQGQDIPAFPD